MLSFWALSNLFEQYTSRWNPVLAAAFIILVINPLALWSVSFQLSFAAVIGIMWAGSKMQRMVILHGRIWQYIGGLLLVSVAAQVGTMPLTLHYCGQTSNYFALTNLLVIPLAFVLLLLGISTLALSWCVVGEWLGIAAKWCTWILREAVEWIESLPYSTTQLTLSAWSVLALYGAILCGVMMMRGEKVRWWWLIGAIGCLLMVLYFELR
jgi:competence protein ComEC